MSLGFSERTPLPHWLCGGVPQSIWNGHTCDVRTNATNGPDGEEAWPSPIRDREWLDPEGKRWRMRGQAIGQREVRRLLKRDDLRVLHVYGLEPKELAGEEREALLRDLHAFYEGEASPYADFRVADFRDEGRHPLLVVEDPAREPR